jgi:hypothetical protein
MPKKWWSIHARTKEAQQFGIDTEEGHVNFGGKSVFNTSNEKIVKAIEAHKDSAFSFYDEQLTKAYDSGSWDVKENDGGTSVKMLHNYTFSVSKPKPLTRWEKIKKFLAGKNLYWFFWYWNTINPKKNREIGVRIFGVEFVKEFK